MLHVCGIEVCFVLKGFTSMGCVQSGSRLG